MHNPRKTISILSSRVRIHDKENGKGEHAASRPGNSGRALDSKERKERPINRYHRHLGNKNIRGGRCKGKGRDGERVKERTNGRQMSHTRDRHASTLRLS